VTDLVTFGDGDEAVHRATDADLGELTRLSRLLIDELGGQRGGRAWYLRSGKSEPLSVDLRRALHDPDAYVVVGTYAHSAVGYVTARLQSQPDGTTWAVVDDVYVEPDARGVGVGEALLDGVLEWAAGCGCTAVDAVVLPGMRESKNFFERFGLVARSISVQRRLGGSQLLDSPALLDTPEFGDRAEFGDSADHGESVGSPR
jgi:GNAT superfamily N-acetyltransferase